MSSTWYVYMVRCADQSLYTGVTTDMTRRLQEHNHDNKKGAKYTRTKRPVVLVYHERHANRSQACQREAAIKRLSRARKLQLIDQAKSVDCTLQEGQ